MILTNQRKHVFRDLRPYVCTYEGCLNPEKLYVTRHDWMYHEGQLHQRSWICGNHCNRKFSTPQLLKEHMLDCHLGTFAESQLPILIDMCERPADPDEKAPCPLCGVEETLRALRSHIASHLEDLALFVLPLETDDHETDANSHHAERPREKDNRLDDDESSSLGSFGEDSHYHHKDKKYHKDKHYRKSSSHDDEHEPPKRIYREHRQKEEPVSPRERLPFHHRAMSYDDEPLHDHDLRGLGRRPTVRWITNTAHPIDRYEERAERRRHDMLDSEIWEKEEAARLRDLARRETAREMMESERMYIPTLGLEWTGLMAQRIQSIFMKREQSDGEIRDTEEKESRV